MRPRKLRMYNIGPFAGPTDIDFTRLDDIFLISGKTGSGKTTIFDAICFALYGRLPGSRKNLEPKIRSDFAGPYEDCWVELEFSLGNATYLVQRSPKMERPKKRGSGTTTEEETAVLYQITERGERRSLSSRKSEADERITRLLGLSADEFAKIVLLPQGEFAQFLQQNSQARREVLRKLFPVDEAVAIRELATEKKKEAEAQLRGAEHTLKEASSRYNETENRTEQERLRRELAGLVEQDRQLVETIKALSEELSLARREREIMERLEVIGAEKRQLDEQGPEIEALTQALTRNQRAKPAQRLLFQEKELEGRGQSLAEEREQAQSQAEAAIHQYEELESRTGEMEALAREAAGLREQKGALTQAAEEERRLTQLEARQDELRTAIQEAEQKLPVIRAEIEELLAQVSACEQAAKEEKDLQGQKDVSLVIMEQLRNLLQIAQTWEKKQPEGDAARIRLTNYEGELDHIEKRLPELAAELSRHEEDQKKRELEALSARLATTLQEGTPCPVCGSIHHPLPARAPAPQYGLEEELAALKREQRDLEERRTELRTELRNLRLGAENLARELEDIENRYQEIRSTLTGILEKHPNLPFTVTSIGQQKPAATVQTVQAVPAVPAIPTVPAVQEDIRKNSSLAESIDRALQRAGKESRNLPRINRLLQEKQQVRASLEARLEADRKQEAELTFQIDEGRGRLQRYLELWKTETISLALNRLQSRLETLDGELTAHENKRRQLVIEKTQAVQRREELEKRWQAHLEAVGQNRRELELMAEELSFESPEQLKAALLPPDVEQGYTARERAWKESLDRLRHQEAEARRSLESLHSEGGKGGAGETVASLEAKLAATEADRLRLAEEEQALQARLHSLEQDRERYQEALERYNSLHRELVRYQALADDLSGANPKKWPFDSWLLSLYLQEVTGYANRRLERMSEGRYSLILNPEGEGGRAMAGLDLSVFDSFTGKTRPCATLSGGESFMASISLALGLADSIQSRSGAVRLDAIFIDEGFGSLDEASLDRALTILDEIRDHRMVGLISHVGEMKSRIPSKIEVIKTNRGSKILISENG